MEESFALVFFFLHACHYYLLRSAVTSSTLFFLAHLILFFKAIPNLVFFCRNDSFYEIAPQIYAPLNKERFLNEKCTHSTLKKQNAIGVLTYLSKAPALPAKMLTDLRNYKMCRHGASATRERRNGECSGISCGIANCQD